MSNKPDLRKFAPLILILFGLTPISCKKGSATQHPQAILDSTHVLQTVVYKAYNTKPSPYDILHNVPPADSVIFTLNRLVGSPDYLYNGMNMSFTFSPYGTGFSFVFGSLILVDDYAVPNFPPGFEANKVYENTTNFSPDHWPVFVALDGNYTSGNFYFTDSIPPDGKDPLALGPDLKTYCKILITKKYVLVTQSGDRQMIDGTISGYNIYNYGLTDTTKYTQRRDYSITFTSLTYYQH